MIKCVDIMPACLLLMRGDEKTCILKGDKKMSYSVCLTYLHNYCTIRLSFLDLCA